MAVDYNGQNYYELLGVEFDASPLEIRKGYRKQALAFHPDRHPENPEEFVKKFTPIEEAYSCLKDPDKRKIYNEYYQENFMSPPKPEPKQQKPEPQKPKPEPKQQKPEKTLDQLNADIQKELEVIYSAKSTKSQKGISNKKLDNLIKQHQVKREKEGVKYEFDKGSAAYDIFMSGHDKAVARTMDDLSKKQGISSPDLKTNFADIATKAPPELIRKMGDVFHEFDERQKGNRNFFKDLINKIANVLNNVFGKGIKNEGVKNAVSDLKKMTSGPSHSKENTRQPAGKFTERVAKSQNKIQDILSKKPQGEQSQLDKLKQNQENQIDGVNIPGRSF